MIGHLVVPSTTVPVYVFDALGNIVLCSEEGKKGALIPFGVRVVCRAGELANPLPWTLSAGAITERLSATAAARCSKMAKVLDMAYPAGELQRTPFPFGIL